MSFYPCWSLRRIPRGRNFTLENRRKVSLGGAARRDASGRPETRDTGTKAVPPGRSSPALAADGAGRAEGGGGRRPGEGVGDGGRPRPGARPLVPRRVNSVSPSGKLNLFATIEGHQSDSGCDK